MNLQAGSSTGELLKRLSELKQAICNAPAEASHRAAYFQLLALTGQWSRALDQLKLVEEFDPESVLFSQVYSRALSCERERQRVFAGETSPVVFGEPAHWLGLLVSSFQLGCSGNWLASAARQAEAFEAAPALGGTINGQAFAWVADADSRLGPVLEAFVEGHYRWIPFERIATILVEPPKHVIDSIWAPAKFVWANGGEADGLIPARYPGSEFSANEAIQAGRLTEWSEKTDGFFLGLGQKVITSDIGDFALLDIRELRLAP